MPESQTTPEPLPGDNDPFSSYIQDHLDMDRLDHDAEVDLHHDDDRTENPFTVRYRPSPSLPFTTTPSRPPTPSPLQPSWRPGSRYRLPEPNIREELGALPLAFMLSRVLRNLYLLLILGFLLMVLLQLLTTAGARSTTGEVDGLRATITAREAEIRALQATIQALQTPTPMP